MYMSQHGFTPVPDKLAEWIPYNRNYMSLLEGPLLFYVASLMYFVAGRVDQTVLALAWTYVGLRFVHSAIHMTSSAENHVVMHTHTRAGMAIAAIKEGLLPISMFATVFHNRIGYHDYEGASLYPDERERIVKSLGPQKAMILKNHGLMVVGQTVPECFLRLYRLERACQIQLELDWRQFGFTITGSVLRSALAPSRSHSTAAVTVVPDAVGKFKRGGDF